MQNNFRYDGELVMPNFDKLSENVNKLKSLLDDRHEGLHTWNVAVADFWKEIVKQWDPNCEKEKIL